MRILRPNTLQLYVLREFAFAMLLASTICTLFMLLASFMWRAQDFEEYGITPAQVSLLTPYLLPSALSYAIPPATMIAATIAFGRLSAENEILAAHAGGAPLRALALPLVICGVYLSGFCLWCNQGGLNWGYSTIRNEVFKMGEPEFYKQLEQENSSITHKLENGDVIHLNLLPHEHEIKTGVVRKPIHLAYFRNQQIGETLIAKDYSSVYEAGSNGEHILLLTLKNAQVLSERPSFFGQVTMRIPLPAPSSLINMGETRGTRGWIQNFQDAVKVANSREMRVRFMLRQVGDFAADAAAGSRLDPATVPIITEDWSEARIAWEGIYATGGAYDRARAERAEGWRKVAQSILPFSMIFLGIGLGLLVKKNNRLIGFLLGMLVYFSVYFPMMTACTALCTAQKVGIWALFLPNILLALGGVVLCADYGRDGPLTAMVKNVLGTIFVSILLRPFALVYRLWLKILGLAYSFLGLFGRKTDGYLIGSFVASLSVVVLAAGVLTPALDFAEHGTEIVQSVLDASRPVPGSGIPVRTQTQAMFDVAAYYGICSLDMICFLLPLLLLIAGLLCISAMIRNREHLILKSSGVKLQRAFRPLILTALLFSLLVTVVKERYMPGLIMERSVLKPRVYHKNMPATAVTILTTDSHNKSVMFEMSQYDSKILEGKNLRVYLLGEARNNRIPVILADVAHWKDGKWNLTMDPTLHLAEPRKKTLKPLPVNCGFLVTPGDTGAASTFDRPDESKGAFFTRTQVKEWHGALTPTTIESERLGPAVLTRDELFAAGSIKSELFVEWWKRTSEWVMGLLLLCMTIPLLVKEEVHGLIRSVAYSILVALFYYGLAMGLTEVARQHHLPPWGLILPHVLCAFASIWLYWIKMET